MKIQIPSRALYLTANENILSKQASSYLSSDFCNRYYIRKNHKHPDVETNIQIKNYVDLDYIVEQSESIFNKLLDVNYCDFSPLSGLHATISTIATCTTPGDYVLTLDPAFCGHFATRELITQLGRNHIFIPWKEEDFTIDFEIFANLVEQHKPSMIFLDHNSPVSELPVRKIREILGEKPLIVYDCSHVLGLLTGKAFPNPIHDGCDILQGNTHKTFPGPSKGIIAFKDETFGRYISKKITSSMVSNVHAHHMIALYITILEMAEFGVEYAKQIIKNQQTFSEYIKSKNISNYHNSCLFSKTHVAFIDLGNINQSFYEKLNDSLIVTNIKRSYNENLIRLGFQEVTRLGFKEEDIIYLASLIYKLAINDLNVDDVKKQINCMLNKFSRVCFSFDK